LGLAGALFGLGYLIAIQYIPNIDRYREQAVELDSLAGLWIVPLAVIGAPLFEEFIFRGLVFRGMRRSLPLGWSMAGSAAVFAICHPPVSLLPVFVMGLLAAYGFELTGWIVTPICIHMTYNGMILLTSLIQKGGHL
jgi:membrane protease YdiL (CAAX protease family)